MALRRDASSPARRADDLIRRAGPIAAIGLLVASLIYVVVTVWSWRANGRAELYVLPFLLVDVLALHGVHRWREKTWRWALVILAALLPVAALGLLIAFPVVRTDRLV